MKVTVFYTVPQIKEMEITEDMIRDLYNKYHNRTKVLEALDWYVQKESGYIDDDGRDLEYYEEEVVDLVYQVIEKIEEEEK